MSSPTKVAWIKFNSSDYFLHYLICLLLEKGPCQENLHVLCCLKISVLFNRLCTDLVSVCWQSSLDPIYLTDYFITSGLLNSIIRKCMFKSFPHIICKPFSQIHKTIPTENFTLFYLRRPTQSAYIEYGYVHFITPTHRHTHSFSHTTHTTNTSVHY